VCLQYIDRDELYLALEFFVQIFETHTPFFIGRSDKAAKDQHHWLLASEIREGNSGFTNCIGEGEIYGHFTNFGHVGFMFLRPGGFNLAVAEDGFLFRGFFG
jgi:hypothetical protein